MKEKKTPKANLENKRSLFIEVGLIIALAVVYLAFEVKSYDAIVVEEYQRDAVFEEEEMIEITQQEKLPELPPPPPQQPLIFQEVEDDVEVEDDIIVDMEADANTEIIEWTPPTVEAEEIQEEEIFTIVEKEPSYPGGDKSRLEFLQKNTKYPQMAREAGIQGTVYVSFVVERDGSITQVKILRGIGGGCDEEAIRVTQLMPKWSPGEQRGRAVRTNFRMPIKFTLQD
ncbi:energy transducer TonB [Bacteroidales bacterium OttesenSCG-928-J16]|nr:energy transducer TonB [Bacteroidales bacterium OttesenSCG-928-J16]